MRAFTSFAWKSSPVAVCASVASQCSIASDSFEANRGPQDDSFLDIINHTAMSFEETLIDVWRQAFAEGAKEVELGDQRYPIVRTSKRKLRQINFTFDDKEIRALEQNPETKSRWAAMARDGKKVMQFLSEGRYVANVVDGKVNLYGGRAARN
jgi:hypothetical protein